MLAGSWLTLIVVAYLKPVHLVKYFNIDEVLDRATCSLICCGLTEKAPLPVWVVLNSDKRTEKSCQLMQSSDAVLQLESVTS